MQDCVDLINEKPTIYFTAYKRHNIFLVLLVTIGIKIMAIVQQQNKTEKRNNNQKLIMYMKKYRKIVLYNFFSSVDNQSTTYHVQMKLLSNTYIFIHATIIISILKQLVC